MPIGYNVPVINYGGGYQPPQNNSPYGNIISQSVAGDFPQYNFTPWSQVTNNPIYGMTAGLFQAPGAPQVGSNFGPFIGSGVSPGDAAAWYNYNQQYWENPANHPASQLPPGVDPNNPPPYTGWQRGGGGTRPQVTPPPQGGYDGGQYGGGGPPNSVSNYMPPQSQGQSGGMGPPVYIGSAPAPSWWPRAPAGSPDQTLPTTAGYSPGLGGVPQSTGLPDYNALMQWLEGLNEPNFNMGGMAPSPGGPTWG